MTSTWEQFLEAVVILAGPGPVKQRLTDAYTQHLADVEADDLPRDIHATLSVLMQAMTSSPRSGGLSAAAASVLKMSEVEAGRHAASVVRIFSGLKQPATLAPVRSAPIFRAVSGAD